VTRLRNDPWLRQRLEELAKDVGNLRKSESADWRVDRACDRVWWLLAATTPTAAEFFRECGDVDVALKVAGEETRRINRLLGDAK
jgi:hypothetical protein